MYVLANPYRLSTDQIAELSEVPFPSVAAEKPGALIRACPRAGQTPLARSPDIAQSLDIDQLIVKDERNRMGLGSFKALGAAYVIARDAADGTARGTTYITASAGNHGLSVAAGADAFGAKAIIYISQNVPQAFADRLRGMGAEVVRTGDTYEESMQAAADAARDQNAVLLSDSSWPGYFDRPYTLMEGYLVLMDEVFTQIDAPPSHIFLQAGVGGLAGAAAAAARAHWGDDPIIVVVEPDAAPALCASITAGKPVASTGPVSCMGRLDCKEPSLIALKGLARDADFFTTISEEEGIAGAALCDRHGLATTPSGGAGVAGLLASAGHREALGLTPTSRVLVILSEGPE